MVIYSLDWYAWGRLLHIRSTILRLDIKHAWEIETTASWKRLNWDHHCFWLIREQTQLQSSIQGLWYHLTCTNCFFFGPDRLTPIQRVSLTTSCPQFSNTQSMTRLECVKPALTWYSHERPSDRFFSLTGVWNQVAVKLPPASHPSFVRFDASQYLRRDEACRYQLLCTEDRILPPSVRSSRAVGWETPHYTASEWQPNSLKDHHGSCWAIRIYFPLPICTPYIEARAVFKSIQTSWRINPWLFLICRSTDCRWEWDCDIEVDSALTSPIVLEPPPNLFPVMTIGRHYEDRRAHERRILPNPPQHGHHGVFLLYGVTRTEYSALVPSPTIWALFRKKNFFFSYTCELMGSEILSMDSKSKSAKQARSWSPWQCTWMLDNSSAEPSSGQKSRLSSKPAKLEKMRHFTACADLRNPKDSSHRDVLGSYFTACTAENLAWSAQHNSVVSDPAFSSWWPKKIIPWRSNYGKI